MTAEIAIMNKKAVALAADSAVTIRGANRDQKIYNSENKLFMLSKYAPVGIMIYGDAEFMGIPWETIIKLFRGSLKKNTFESLTGYATKLIEYLEKPGGLISKEEQKKWFDVLVYVAFSSLKNDIQLRIQETQDKSIGLPEAEIEKLSNDAMRKEIITQWETLRDLKVLKNLESINVEEIKTDHADVINSEITNTFQKLPLDDDLKHKLIDIAVWTFTKNTFQGSTGVVIAGFGIKDVFPVYVSFECQLVFKNKLKHTELDVTESAKSGSVIRFFAQSDMAKTFVRGVDPAMSNYSRFVILKTFKELKDTFLARIKGSITDPKNLEPIEKDVDDAVRALIKSYGEQMEEYRKNEITNPILETIATMPKDELAIAAETLVNVTSFKRKVSGEAQTVGGPIDVAVISKCDGFIWIKRKHYFSKELNMHFAENYFKED
jgi:hypothetical protein